MTTPDKDHNEKGHIEALCAAKGMRMTEQRRVIARVLAASADHPDVEELYRRCVTISARAARATRRCETATTIISSTCATAK